MATSDLHNYSTETNVDCIQSNELNSNSTVQGIDPNNSMELQSGSQCDASPEVSSTSSLLEFGRFSSSYLKKKNFKSYQNA
jgi:hypothetical protein